MRGRSGTGTVLRRSPYQPLRGVRRIDQDLGAARIPVAVRFDRVEMEPPYDRDAIPIEELEGGSLVKGAVDFGHFRVGPGWPSFEGRGRGEVTNFVANGGNVG